MRSPATKADVIASVSRGCRPKIERVTNIVVIRYRTLGIGLDGRNQGCMIYASFGRMIQQRLMQRAQGRERYKKPEVPSAPYKIAGRESKLVRSH